MSKQTWKPGNMLYPVPAEWIEEGKKSITRIAVELGYDNFHYFAKVFAREHGCTPSEYRKESKNV